MDGGGRGESSPNFIREDSSQVWALGACGARRGLDVSEMPYPCGSLGTSIVCRPTSGLLVGPGGSDVLSVGTKGLASRPKTPRRLELEEPESPGPREGRVGLSCPANQAHGTLGGDV